MIALVSEFYDLAFSKAAEACPIYARGEDDEKNNTSFLDYAGYCLSSCR